MRGIESSVVYPAWISFGCVDIKACSPFLSSVYSSSRVSSHFSERRWILFNSCSWARRGYIAWAQPIFLLPGFLSSEPHMRFGSVSCDSRTRVGEDRWIASRRAGCANSGIPDIKGTENQLYSWDKDDQRLQLLHLGRVFPKARKKVKMMLHELSRSSTHWRDTDRIKRPQAFQRQKDLVAICLC